MLIKKLNLSNYIKLSDSILDIGCYDGVFLRSLEVKERIGIDLEVIKQKHIHIIKATAEHIPFKRESIRIMTAFDVLEHIGNQNQLINQITVILKKNGLFIFTIPYEKENIFPKFLKNWLNFSRWGHKRVGYNQESLKKLFKGWTIKILYWNTDLSNLLYFPLQFLWKLFQKFTRLIINKIIEIEYIRTRKNSLPPGHLVVLARKR